MDLRVAAAISMMQQLKDGNLSIVDLSKKVNLSPSRLWQLFRKETGQSPKQYLKTMRMQRARKLLEETFLSIKEIAFLSGSTDISHFVRDFKKGCGVTPKEFRSKSRAIGKENNHE